MITKKKLETLKVIFSDCDLIDVDFSRWDSLVSIYLVADHLPLPTPGKRALVALRFRGVRKFEWEFRHHDVTGIPMQSEPDDHLQWNIYKSQFTAAQPLTTLVLSGSPDFPVIKLRFENVDIEPVDHAVFADVNPRWSHHTTGLGRPGIEELRRLVKRSRAK